jgi:cell division transport system permease protein
MSAVTTRLLDGARPQRAMVWVIAIMLFLTVLAAGAGVGIARGVAALGAQVAGRATVQIATADPMVRTEQAARALAALRALPAVARADPVPRAELARLLGPWLGEAAADGELPVPELIDVTFADVPDAARQVAAALAEVAPGARVDGHDAAMGAVGTLLSTLAALAFGVVVLMIVATTAVVVLAARAGLEAHRVTIEVMHGLGATDVQVARLFQRRIARDAALGAGIGGVAALAVVAAVGWQVGRLGSSLLGGMALGGGGWAMLLLLPAAFVLLAALAARRAVTRALARAL